MKILFTNLLLLLSFYSFSQSSSKSFQKTVNKIKTKSKIDINDKSALNLLDDFYNEALQADKGELEGKTINKLQTFMNLKVPKTNIL
ncbi:hypothetical protein [Rufibacter sp. XAAS-G3-1]|uniref:hypothetical protein n=1 Tax=Rufibacter sp. XAAS-G3-1 TaxID=2729134 RepID=UPI0015E75548|nr:hypothetical protein [Rufibacter sp. XAAS-G3-1]